ncbi:MAG: amino acid racemase, partial [Patescibacteria group bacterium]
MSQYKTIGIIGGMGPWAAVEFEKTLLELVGAEDDFGYPPIICHNNTDIPDRATAMLEGGESPVPALVRMAQNLIDCGAEILCMPCNTAHYFFNDINKNLNHGIVFVNMIECVCNTIKKCRINKVGLLATDATIQTNLYQDKLVEINIELIAPDDSHQKKVMKSIYGAQSLKAGNIEQPSAWLKEASDNLISKGAEMIILGCTELPIGIKRLSVPLINSNLELAKEVLQKA